MTTLERVTPQTSVRGLWPLVLDYLREVPEDPWADRFDGPEGLQVHLCRTFADGRYLTLVARAPGAAGIVGFLVAEMRNDPKTRKLVAIVHFAYVAPGFRTKAVRLEAVKRVKEWARALGATYVACLAARGPAMERLLGWKYAGSYQGRDFLLAEA